MVGAFGLHVADMDDDNDLDVVATAVDGNAVFWYENSSWIRHTIDGSLSGACDVYVADMDDDDTLDVIATGWYADNVIWYEAPSWTKHFIDQTQPGARGVYVADMDDDNDLDVVATGWFADDVVWYENALAVEEEQGSNQPAVINLAQPFPNPFSKKTNIRYQITAHPASQREAGDNSKARLRIYNATGRLVRQWDDATIRLSDHVIWDGTDNSGEKVSTGIYFVELTTTQNKQMRKLLIVR